MKRILVIATLAFLLTGCKQYPDHSVVVNSTDALVETSYGTLCGYIEDGIYTFKGISYAKADRFMPPQDPEPWEGVQTALYYGHQCYQGPRVTWEDDCEAFLYQWDDGTQSDDCQYLNVWTKGINDLEMPWPHLSQLVQKDTLIKELYQVNSIPDNLLIDPQGKIVARNLRGEALQAKLKEIFGE